MVYPVIRLTLLSFIRLWIKRIYGANNLPNCPFIAACNHASFYDDLALPSVIIPLINKKIHIYVNRKFFKNYFLRKFLNHGSCIPVDVQKNKESKQINENAFKSAIRSLRKGDPVGIFPEGHRSVDGKLQQAKVGVARLALAARAPIVPIGIVGSYNILPKGKTMPALKRCEIRIGKPMYFNEYYGKENDKKTLRAVTTKVMREIAKLTSQKYNFN